MLCDEMINAEGMRRSYVNFEPIQKAIQAARKFVLSPDFTAAADGFMDNREEIARVAPFCRLPFATTWFEFAQADREHFTKADMSYPILQGRPKRVGFLCEASDDSMARWRTTLHWTLHEPLKFATMPTNASIICVHFDTTREGVIDNMIETGPAPFLPRDMALLDKKGLDDFFRICLSDWGGELLFLFSVLALLNSRNVTETEAVDKAAHNAKRARKGQPPLCSHTILKIRALHRPSLLPPKASAGEKARELRAHFVRGHFKQRRTGLFWWGPHVRGSRERGTVTHDYEVTT